MLYSLAIFLIYSYYVWGSWVVVEDAIKNLESWTDEATKEMLQNVVKRKRKFDKYEKRHLIVVWLTVFGFIIYGIYLYITVYQPNSYSAAEMFNAFVSNSYNGYYLFALFGLFGYMNVLKKLLDKYEKEYHALRCEIIDKSADLWKGEGWEKRHLVFEMMKNKYDINLYHENK
jgi:hypothetical protein